MELEEKKMGKETRTSNLIYNGKNRKQKEEENENKKKRRTEIYNILNYGTKKRQTKEDKQTKSKQTKGITKVYIEHTQLQCVFISYCILDFYLTIIFVVHAFLKCFRHYQMIFFCIYICICPK